MRIGISSIFVGDQDAALRFYTEVLGFVKKRDIPVGDYRFLTVVAPDEPAGMELLLEPNVHAAAKAYQKAIFQDGIPATMFFVDDLNAEHKRMNQRGVKFKVLPTNTEHLAFAVFDDTCGNLIQLVQE